MWKMWWCLTLTYHIDTLYLFWLLTILMGRFVCARLKIVAVRTLLAQMPESEERAICDGMDGAAISAKSAAFVA
jgi:hypothetical protein